MVCKLNDTQKAEKIFGDWQETLIWSCLQKIMGEIYVDNLENPQSAMAVLGDFCFFAGEWNKELVMYKPENCNQDFIIMIPQNDGWADLIASQYKDRAKKVIRYAIKKEENIFDKNKLQGIIHALPSGYSIKMIDEEIFNWCKENDWSRDLVSQFENYEMYKKLGLGAVILKEGIPVSGASSYSRYQDGIEIEIDTKEEYRRKGLAYTCGAKMILECLERNLYPSWDAQNKWSVALAEKLGYHYSHDYTAFEVMDY